MTLQEASEMLFFNGKGISKGNTWMDLGCGEGLFTKALAGLIPEESTIYAIDKNSSALNKIPDHFANTHLIKIQADFTDAVFPVSKSDGILIANALHYVKEKLHFLQKLNPYLHSNSVFCIIEYDLDQPNHWVPYPIRKNDLNTLFASIGFNHVEFINQRSSIFNKAKMYSGLIRK
jgi:ubiquinone/menaquinone biosynthesis C-methylase UbiE